MVLPPAGAGFGGTLDQQTILDFVDSGHNVLLAASSEVSEAMRSLAAEFGVDLDDKGTKLFDHFSRGAAGGGLPDDTLVASSELADAPTITGGPYKVREGGWAWGGVSRRATHTAGALAGGERAEGGGGSTTLTPAQRLLPSCMPPQCDVLYQAVGGMAASCKAVAPRCMRTQPRGRWRGKCDDVAGARR